MFMEKVIIFASLRFPVGCACVTHSVVGKKSSRDTITFPDDPALMGLVRAGELNAFGILVERHQKALLNFFRRLGVYNDAEDLVQECFLRIYRYRESYRADAKFTTFLYRVGRTVWIDWVRRKSRREGFLTRYEMDCETRATGYGQPEGSHLDAQAALDALPEKLRITVVMSLYQGLKYEEIAEALRIPLGTVKSRMSLAFEQLRKFIYAGHNARKAGC